MLVDLGRDHGSLLPACVALMILERLKIHLSQCEASIGILLVVWEPRTKRSSTHASVKVRWASRACSDLIKMRRTVASSGKSMGDVRLLPLSHLP